MHAMMQMVDSDLTLDNAASKEVMREQSMISALFMDSREAILRLVMLRLTLLSPTTDTSRDIVPERKSAQLRFRPCCENNNVGHVYKLKQGKRLRNDETGTLRTNYIKMQLLKQESPLSSCKTTTTTTNISSTVKRLSRQLDD